MLIYRSHTENPVGTNYTIIIYSEEKYIASHFIAWRSNRKEQCRHPLSSATLCYNRISLSSIFLYIYCGNGVSQLSVYISVHLATVEMVSAS